MFLRRKNKSARGVGYSYWSLCETYRTARGPRQRVVASLGKLDEPEAATLAQGWDDLTALLTGERAVAPAATPDLPQLALPPPAAPPPPRHWEQVDVRGVRVERTRDFGEVYLGLALWRRLKLDELLGTLLPAGREAVDWGRVAALLTIARFCAQRSELGIAEHWYGTTALDDLLGVAPELVNDDRLYRALDQLGEHKDALCTHLMERYRQWFGVRFEFLLYDVTSTFFEGQAARNDQAQRGYSRDQRPDCKQVCIGLVYTPEGLPLSFEVFPGNRADVTTVEEIVTSMETKYGVAERIWVMDRGMVSEANIAFLRARKARYLVGTPKSWLRHHEATLLEQADWREVQAGLEVRLVAHPDGEAGEKYVLCRSAARAEKERAMLQRQSDALTAALAKIDTWLGRTPQTDLEAVGRRVGRALGKYPAAAAIVQARVQRRPRRSRGRAANRERRRHGPKSAPAKRRVSAAHQLRGDRSGATVAVVYPAHAGGGGVSHRQERPRAAPHLSPAGGPRAGTHFGVLPRLGAVAHARTMDARQGPGHLRAATPQNVAGIKSMDVLLPVKRGELTAELRLRVVATPEPATAQLLAHLGLRLPKGPREIANVVPKTGV